MHKLFFILIAVLISSACLAQESKQDRKENRKQRISALIKQEEEGVIAYHKHLVYGLKLTNDGYGAFLEVGRAQSIRKALLYQLDIAERKNAREQKQTNINIPASPFIFGKINFFYPVKLGVQYQYLLGNKSNKNGVSVTANAGGGISAGLLRPYYLEITDTALNARRAIKYDSRDSTTFKDAAALGNFQVSGARFSKGWSDIKVNMGLYAKASLRFDYGRFNETVSALEVGVTAEMYSRKVQQILQVEPQRLFINAYVAIMFGKRK